MGARRAGPGLEAARRRLFGAAAVAIVVVVAFLLLWPWQERRPEEDAVAPDGDAPAGEAEEDDAELPYELSRGQVREVLRELAPLVASCPGRRGRGGEIRVHLEIHGPTGQVKNATVAKHLAGTEVAACATKIVEAAQFPRFRKKSLTVVFPYTLPADADAGADAEGSR